MGAIKDIYEIAKELISSAKAIGNHELAVQAIEMYEKLIDMKKDYQELEEKYNNFLYQKDIEKRIERNNGDAAYYTDDNGKKFVICTGCWDNNRKIVQVKSYDNNAYRCPVCKDFRHIIK